MKRKIKLCCLFVIMVVVVTPIVASNSTISGQQESILGKGYLLIHVFSFTPGSGFHPYQGANISVRGFLYSYNGTTDEYGDCLFTVFTKLFRAKIYFIKITIDLPDRVVTRRDIVYMSLREIEYKEYLFINKE